MNSYSWNRKPFDITFPHTKHLQGKVLTFDYISTQSLRNFFHETVINVLLRYQKCTERYTPVVFVSWKKHRKMAILYFQSPMHEISVIVNCGCFAKIMWALEQYKHNWAQKSLFDFNFFFQKLSFCWILYNIQTCIFR